MLSSPQISSARHEAAVAAQAVRDGAELGPYTAYPSALGPNATEGLRTTWGSTLYADHVPNGRTNGGGFAGLEP